MIRGIGTFKRSPGTPRLAESARILSGPIFLSKQKRPIDRTTLHLLMKKYGAAAGIPEKLTY
jgi:hypothetical protein